MRLGLFIFGVLFLLAAIPVKLTGSRWYETLIVAGVGAAMVAGALVI